MGWFDNQIKMRMQQDEEAFSDSFIHIAGAIMGKKLTAALHGCDGAGLGCLGLLRRFRLPGRFGLFRRRRRILRDRRLGRLFAAGGQQQTHNQHRNKEKAAFHGEKISFFGFKGRVIG